MNELLLGVNIDHVATLRNVRNTNFPDPIQAAFVCEQAGADSITIHLREDRRHITDRDINLLCHTIQTRINLEMAVTNKTIDIACNIKPYSVCLVPENRQEITTEGGLDVLGQIDKIKLAIQKLNNVGIVVSLFVNADYRQIESATIAGAKYIEIHTGEYANAPKREIRDTEFIRIHEAVKFAANLNLKVNAGHGLTYHNVQPIASISELCELNIGHSIISRALFSGMKDAVKDMKRLIQSVQRY